MRVTVTKIPFTLGPTLGPILGLSLQTIGAGALADESRLTSFTHSFISGCANEMESGFDQSSSCLIDQVLEAWRPSKQKGEILYVRRAIAEVDAPQAGEVKAEFVQDAAHTGSSVKIKVSLSEPAAEDQRYLLRLRPGTGEIPAVEGEDFNGEPIVVQINQGERETFTAVQLILNSAMRVSRNLDVSVTRWSEDALAVATQ